MTSDERRVDQLADEISSLSAHIQAATCRWLALVAEFDEREGWGSWGARSCAHWISWRCSIALGPAREYVRVARRLRELPLVREAFGRGELSYSKVRALTRVEDVEREAELVEVARHCTAAHLERAVQGYRQVLRIDAVRAHAERSLSVIDDDDGSVVIRGRLPREEGAILLKALEMGRDQARAAAMSATADGSDAGSGGGAAHGAQAETAERATRDVPAGMENPVHCGRPAQNADALVAIAEAALAAGTTTGSRSGGERYQVVVHIDAETLTGGDEHGRSELEDGPPIAPETARRIACDAALVPLIERAGKPLSVGRKTRAIPPALQRALRSRDGGCRFPGCAQRKGVDAHHVTHWAHGGRTSLANLVQLCRHHHRLVHEGGYSVEARGSAFVFRRPNGQVLRPSPRPPRGDHHRVRESNRRLGLAITPETPVPRWYGEPLDLGLAVDALLGCAPPEIMRESGGGTAVLARSP